MELIFGFTLMGLGMLLFFVGRSKSRIIRVEASNGSVAIGGKNSGTITNTIIGDAPAAPAASHGTHWLTVVSIVVELAGMAVVIWHAWHLAAK